MTEYGAWAAEVLLEQIRDAVSGLDTSGVVCRVFPSNVVPEVVLDTTANEKSLPGVVIAGIPDDTTVQFAGCILSMPVIVETSGSSNSITGTNYVRVKKSGGSWINAILMVNGSLALDASTAESRDPVGGLLDCKSQIDGNGTYEIQFNNVIVQHDSVKIKDSQTSIVIVYG